MTTAEIKQKVIDYAYGCGLDPNVALAQIGRESGFREDARGSSGERGLAQIMPGTWERFAQGVPWDAAFDVDYNLSTWCNYMGYLSGLFGGDIRSMLMAYNGGEGHLLDPGRYGGPSQAAQRYAAEILTASGGEWSGSDQIDIAQEPNQPEEFSNWIIWALAIGGVLIAFVVAKD